MTMLTDHYGGVAGSMFMPEGAETMFADKRTGENTFDWSPENCARELGESVLGYSVELYFWFDEQDKQIPFSD